MKRVYIYCFEFSIERTNGSPILKREFGYKELKSKEHLIHSTFWDCFKETLSPNENELYKHKERGQGVNVIWLKSVDNEDQAKEELQKVRQILHEESSQVSLGSQKCKLKINDNIKDFLKDENHQICVSLFFGYTISLFFLFFFGLITKFWFLFNLFVLPFLLASIIGGIAGFLFLAWILGNKVRKIVYEKLGIDD